MSKSKISEDPGKHRMPCTYLYSDLIPVKAAYRINPHKHEVWQVDLAIKGRFDAILDGVTFRVSRGKAIFSKPGTRHEFRYAKGLLLMSFKFRGPIIRSDPRLFDWEDQPFARSLIASLRALFDGGHVAVGSEFSASCLVSAFMGIHAEALRTEEEEPEIIREARRYLRTRRGRCADVTDVAAHLGYSAGHASELFRRHHGRSLKRFIDRERAELAAELVEHSERTFSQISTELGFSDVARFSRFFRRMLASSPRVYRQRRR